MAYFDLSTGGHLRAMPGNTLPFMKPDRIRPRLSELKKIEASSSQFPQLGLRELDIRFDKATNAMWCAMRPSGPPSFTPSMLRELISLRRAIQTYTQGRDNQDKLRFFIGRSDVAGIYNLGGDLDHFVAMIRQRDREGLRAYAVDCCDVAYHMTTGFDSSVLTIGLVQGDALGGGFEGAMSFNILVAERKARMGLPEILFNLFPGMGAMSFLTRKVGLAIAQRMIMSGKIYTAEELHEMGVVDILVEDGAGEDAVCKFIAGGQTRHRLHLALAQARQRVLPLSFEELRDITDIWVNTAMQLGENDLRRMERLAAAQRKRLARA